MIRRLKKLFKWLILSGVTLVLIVVIANLVVCNKARGKIYRFSENADPKYTGIILGSLVYGDNRLSNTTRLRADKAVELYRQNKIERILVSGDHGQKDYDEVNAITNYLIGLGIPQSDIFMDHAGFDTYDSMVRAKKVFKVDEAIIISQEFHLVRAVYIAESIGLNSIGVAADDSPHLSLDYMNNREKLARVKAFLDVVFNSSPKFLGDPIPITGSSAPTYDS